MIVVNIKLSIFDFFQIDTMAQFVSIIMYVGTMLYVLFACYYSANEMLEEVN